MTSTEHAAPCDPRLRQARQLLDVEDIAVVSFDVFDTLLCRSVVEPADAFVLLGRQLLRAGILVPGMTAETFASARRRAEARAREHHPDPEVPEVSLEEIYDQLPPTLFASPRDALVEAELELERSIVFPDLDVASFAVEAQRLGKRLILCSDTYLSSTQLLSLFQHESLTVLDFSRVFTSSERQAGKGNRMFRAVLDDLRVSPNRILHIGDHPISDVEAPRRFGIHAVHYQKLDAELATVVDLEQGIRAHQLYERRLGTDSGGDFGITALRARAAHRSRAAVEPELADFAAFGAAVLGPAFTGYAGWVHRRAEELGAPNVFGIMREGAFLSRLLRQVGGDVGSPVTAEPIWLSRRVCTLAAVDRLDVDTLHGFVYRRTIPTVDQFCRELGLDASGIPAFADLRPSRMDDLSVRDSVVGEILTSDGLGDAVLDHCARLRRRLVKAVLERAGGRRELLLTDLGWSATIQRRLDAALRLEGVDLTTKGLYLVTTEATVDALLEGVHAEGFLATAGLPEPLAQWIIRSPEIIEQVCMCDEGSLVDIADDGGPILGPPSQPPAQRLQRAAVQRGILRFAHEWYRHRSPRTTGTLCLGSAEAAETLSASLLRFVVEPTAHEVDLFGGWVHDENFGTDRVDGVVAGDLAAVVRHLTPEQILGLPMSRVYWPFALVAAGEPTMLPAVASVVAGALPHTAFSSSHVFPLVVEWGDGTVPDHQVRADTRCNRNGLYFFRLDALEDSRMLRLTFGDGPCVVRLDHLRVQCRSRGGGETVTLLREPSEFGALDVDAGHRRGPNVLLGGSRGASVALRLAAPDGPLCYRFELEVAWAAMPTAAIAPPSKLELARPALRRSARRLSPRRRRDHRG